MFDEIRIAEAFRHSSHLSEADLQDLVKRMTADGKEWKRKNHRQENVGEIFDPVQIERGRESAEIFRRKSNWMRRKLSDADKEALKSAWPA